MTIRKGLFAGLIMGCVLALSHLPAAEASPVALIINQNTYHSEPSPELIRGRVYVPLRTISEGLGYEVGWDQTSKTVSVATADYNGAKPVNKSGQIGVFINGEPLHMPAQMGKPYLKQPGYTMVPLRAVSEGLGAEVSWHDGLVSVNSSGSEKASAPLIEKKAEAETTWLPESHVEAPQPETGQPETAQPAARKPASPADEMSILGDNMLSLEQVNRFLSQKENELRQRAAANGRTFVPFPKDIGALYLNIAPKYGIRGDVALAQAIQETGYFQYGNEVLPSQNNYCGLGAVGRRTTEEDLEKQVFSSINPSVAHLTVGLHGWSYASPAIGVEAHLQHLYSYASAAKLPAGCELYDGRFNHGNRGKAVVWSDLNGRWAVPGNGYGETIVEQIWAAMKKA